MSKLAVTGTVSRSDLEGGAWTLVSDQGVVYQLRGGGADLLRDGVRAEVHGQVGGGIMGIAMLGDVLTVVSYRILGS